MKKIIALFMSIVMLACCAAASAEEAGKVSIGTISINGAFMLQCGIPEGYGITTLVEEPDQLVTQFSAEDPEKPSMMLSVAFDETYSDVDRMNDLDEEALALLEESYTAMDDNVEISYGETGLGTLLLIARSDSEQTDYIDFLSVYKGYFIEFIMVASQQAEDRNLSDDQLRLCVDFLTDLDFIPIEDSAASLPEGSTFPAAITGYDEGANTLHLQLKAPVTFQPADVETALENGLLVIGGEEYGIEQVTRDENTILINDELELRLRDDGLYTAYEYEYQKMTVISELDCAVTEGMVFIDQIDPESLEPLDEPVHHTAAEFLEALEKEAEGMGPGFAADNVEVTFNGDGDLIQIVRMYVPWQ